MSKRFRVAPGYLVRKGTTWRDHVAGLTVNAGEHVMIYKAPAGNPRAPRGSVQPRHTRALYQLLSYRTLKVRSHLSP